MHGLWLNSRPYVQFCCCLSVYLSVCLSGQHVNVCMCVSACWASFEIKGLCPVMNKNWFCRMPVHTRVAERAWNGGCICPWGHPSLTMYFCWSLYTLCIYSHARWSYRMRFRSLLLCPLSVERYYFPLFVDSLFEKQVFLLKTLGDWILNIRVRLGIVQQDSRR